VKRLLIASGIGIAVFAAVFAAAATLGLTSDQLGAGDRIVSSCTTPINVTYETEYDAALASTDSVPGRYRITDVVLNGLNETACAGQAINLILTDEAGAPLPNITAQGQDFTCCGVGEGQGGLLDITALNVDPRLVDGIHVLITGQSVPPTSAQP
jgi:hypothetical protein